MAARVVCSSDRALVAVVDADPAVAALLAEVLAQDGLAVTTRCPVHVPFALDVVCAFLRAQTPRLVLFDVPHPYAQSWRVLHEVHVALPALPVVVLTTSPADHDGRVGEDGVVAVVRKPFDLEDLLGIVRQALAQR